MENRTGSYSQRLAERMIMSETLVCFRFLKKTLDSRNHFVSLFQFIYHLHSSLNSSAGR